MPRRFDHCFVVVRDDGISQQSSRRSVDKDQRRALLTFHMKVALIFGDRGQDQSIDPATGERIDHDSLAMGIVLQARGQDCRVTAISHGLDSTVKLMLRMGCQRRQGGGLACGLAIAAPQQTRSLVRLEIHTPVRRVGPALESGAIR